MLGALFANLQSKEDIPKALKAYERLRKPRADWAVEQARITGALRSPCPSLPSRRFPGTIFPSQPFRENID